MTTAKLGFGLAVSVLLTSTAAQAADLLNRGGTSDVPSYQGRVYYIKPAGAACPAGVTCFCNSGAKCNLPASPAMITGTVVVDRPGVTLDCQDRWIQAPRWGGSRQACSSSSQCGTWSDGSPHACVNGMCQLNGLGGVNVGGPVNVNQGSIKIDNESTGYVQGVQIRNCNVRSHYVGYQANAFEGDDGDDDLRLYTSELHSNYHGAHVRASDNSYMFGNSVHDNYQFGLDYDYNWQLEVTLNTVRDNGYVQVHYHGDANHANRWLLMWSNTIISSFFPDPYVGTVGNVRISDLVGTGEATCWGDADLCDFRFESNSVSAHNNQPEIELVQSYWAPSTVLEGNRMSQYDSFVDVLEQASFANDPRCWTKDNKCSNGGSTPFGSCQSWQMPSAFATAPCWY